MTIRLVAKLRGYIHGVFPTQISDLENNVPYLSASSENNQQLTPEQQRATLQRLNAIANLANNFVRHDVDQTLNDESKERARKNIDVYSCKQVDDFIDNIQLDALTEANEYADKIVGELAKSTAIAIGNINTTIGNINTTIGDEEYTGFEEEPNSLKDAINILAGRTSKPVLDPDTLEYNSKDQITAKAIRGNTTKGEKIVTPQLIANIEEEVSRLAAKGGYLTPYDFGWDGIYSSVKVGDSFTEYRNGKKTKITVVSSGGDYPQGTSINLLQAQGKAVDWQVQLFDWATEDIWGVSNNKIGDIGGSSIKADSLITLAIKQISTQSEPFCEVFGVDADGNSYGVFQKENKIYFGTFTYDTETQEIVQLESNEIWDGVSQLIPFRYDYKTSKDITVLDVIERPFGGESGINWDQDCVVWGHDFHEIFNGTRVINEYNNWELELTNTPSTEPPVLGWSVSSIDQDINYATDEQGGIVRTQGTSGENENRVYGVLLDPITKRMYVDSLGKDIDDLNKGKLSANNQTTDKVQVYGKETSGAQKMLDIDADATPGTIVVRDANGRISVADPENESDAVNKKHLDASIKQIDADVLSNTKRIEAEEKRAQEAEQSNATAISEEIRRAETAEGALSQQIAGKAPTLHASSDNKYGQATSDLFGHVKLSDIANEQGVNDGVAATPGSVKAVKDALEFEVQRAKDAEENIASSVSEETLRATAAEKENALAISAEVSRATAAENKNKNEIDKIAQKQVVLANGGTETIGNTEKPLATQEYVDAHQGSGGSDEPIAKAHINDKNNPHEVTKEQIGLENVANERQYSENNPPPYPVSSVAGKTGAVQLNKSDVGLDQVDNTSDADKPISNAAQAALDEKLGKRGNQAINGNLTIVKEGDGTGNLVVQGNLEVKGSTIVKDTETLAVKDNIIVTNSDNATLTSLSGLVIKTSQSEAYGMVYDPTSQSVKLGSGLIGEDGEFTFSDGEGNAIAIRDDDSRFTNGHLVQWDAENKKFVDGGAKSEKLPNPNKIVIGTKEYDGSQQVNIAIGDIGAEPAFTKNSAFNKNFGNTAGTVCEGNDSRVINAVQSMTFAGTEVSKTGNALEITQSEARKALGLGSAAYTNSDQYASAQQVSTNTQKITEIIDGTIIVPKSSSATSAETAKNASTATNVSTQINGKNIVEIFETDGKTVKNSTNADTVDNKHASDFATAAQGSKADTSYQKPSDGIPETDLSEIVSEKLNRTIPTKLSELTNDVGFITKVVTDLANYYTKTQIDEKIASIPKFSISVVSELPTENISTTTVYLVKDMQDTGNLYTEYIYVNGAWEELGAQKIDLTGYATEEWVALQIADFITAEQLNALAQKVDTHIANKSNPHGVTAAQTGAEPAFEKKSAFNKDFGTTEGTVCQGNDSRLSDARPANGGNSATVGGKSPSDFATAAQGGKADTAYQKPSTGIPETDLSAAVTQKLNREIPTALSQLQNDTGFITNLVTDLVNYYTKTQVDNLISTIPKFAIAVVDTLPTQNISTTTVYLLKENEDSGNLYTEYIYVNNTWEVLGSQKVDLTGYATETWVNAQIADFVTLEQLQEVRNIAESAYKKPSEGIPESDLAKGVRDKLDKEYTLPIANPTTLGGVKPATKTAEMTQGVGVDENGGLWTTPSGGGGSDVVANPDDEATEELYKLGVDGKTYAVPATVMTVSDVDDPNAIEIKTIAFGGDKYRFPVGGGAVAELLWSGSWNGDSTISVPNINKYSMFLIKTDLVEDFYLGVAGLPSIPDTIRTICVTISDGAYVYQNTKASLCIKFVLFVDANEQIIKGSTFRQDGMFAETTYNVTTEIRDYIGMDSPRNNITEIYGITKMPA